MSEPVISLQEKKKNQKRNILIIGWKLFLDQILSKPQTRNRKKKEENWPEFQKFQFGEFKNQKKIVRGTKHKSFYL